MHSSILFAFFMTPFSPIGTALWRSHLDLEKIELRLIWRTAVTLTRKMVDGDAGGVVCCVCMYQF